MIQAHRDAQGSRISSFIAVDDLVLVGGRITTGSGFTNTVPPISSAEIESDPGTLKPERKNSSKKLESKNDTELIDITDSSVK